MNDNECITIKFDGCCADKCFVCPTKDGSLIFGSGIFDIDTLSWEFPCYTCKDSWRSKYKYLFDLVVMIQLIMIGTKDPYYIDVNIDLNQEHLNQIEKSFKYINFISPFENIIKIGVKGIIGTIRFAISLDNFADSFKK